MELILPIIMDIQPGRLIESLIFLAVLLWKINPHFKIIEKRLLGMDKGIESLRGTMTESFKAGEQRFSSLEHRIELIDDKISEFQNNLDKGIENGKD